jgi:hypothetical protein
MNTEEFFIEAFKGAKVPENIRRLSERLCRSYGIRGICDPMYIANIIALELGLGDGQNNFKKD